MTHDESKIGFGVVDADGLNVRTIGDTSRAAIVNWLVVVKHIPIFNQMTDAQIHKTWEKHRGDATVKRVRIYIQ